MRQDKSLNFQLTFSKKQFILKIDIDCHMRYIIFTLILMLTAGIAGYTIGAVKPTLKGTVSPVTQNQEQKTNANPLFQTQSATITGEVTAVSDKTLTISDTKKQTGQFIASDQLIVLSLDSKPTPASPAAALKSIELNKMALINLQMEDGQFKVVSIGYLPQNPPSNPK